MRFRNEYMTVNASRDRIVLAFKILVLFLVQYGPGYVLSTYLTYFLKTERNNLHFVEIAEGGFSLSSPARERE